MTDELLFLDNLYKTFPVKAAFGKSAVATAVDGVTLSVARGEAVGLVGESGAANPRSAGLRSGCWSLRPEAYHSRGRI
jgi:ABC-type microcin C transport system duplicated ATPase subunit YejF